MSTGDSSPKQQVFRKTVPCAHASPVPSRHLLMKNGAPVKGDGYAGANGEGRDKRLRYAELSPEQRCSVAWFAMWMNANEKLFQP